MDIHYLEIVTKDVARKIAVFEAAQGLSFGDPIPELGGARTAPAPGGGTIAVRGPLREDEASVVRPYFLTDTIEKDVSALSDLGVTIAMPPTEIPGRGRFAIYIEDGIEYGLWQV